MSNKLLNVYQIKNQEEVKNYYTQWADTYEKDIRDLGYNGAYLVVKHFLEFNVPKESRILDIGAGTGVVGELLAANGYTNVDALDGTPRMLEIARKKNCYRNYINSSVVPGIPLPIPDRTYDVAIMAGIFCPGHIRVEAFDQVIRIVRKGGLICWVMGAHENYADLDQQFRNRYFSDYLQKLCAQKKWKYIDGYPIQVKNYNLGKDGLFYAMKVT